LHLAAHIHQCIITNALAVRSVDLADSLLELQTLFGAAWKWRSGGWERHAI
jgi:hypothetical protein